MTNQTDIPNAPLPVPAPGRIDEAAQAVETGPQLTIDDVAAGFVATVRDQGLIAVSGDDAAKFLHTQLTNDVEHLTPGDVRFAGFCTPKGRLQASFLMWRDLDAVYLQLPRTIQAPLQKRLSMFVMRSKARLVDATDAAPFATVLGLGGAKAQAALGQIVPTLPTTPMTKTDGAFGTVLRLNDAFGAPRYLWLTSPDTANAVLAALGTQLAVGGDQAWQLASIHAAEPQVGPATQEQFVPQMINLELLGGVNFKKGCYPGQEIVARTKYLGKIKRRAALARIDDANARSGDEVFSTLDPSQPCGMVVNVAPNGIGGADALVEIKLAQLNDAVHLGSASGARVTFLPMPYSLDALDD
ncbi:folate-binding protein [Massilia aurea]|uniref:CAF17-like 4Fe-4S cluster assembly/insertion protein YgfZ n=1 Tax=Massilia aurea TaxID=373040 RepID=UPI0034624F69